MGIVSQRRRRQRIRRIGRRVLVAALVLLMMIPAASKDLRMIIRDAAGRFSLQVFSGEESGQVELTLPQRKVYALQLGVFDDGKRAQEEMSRLQKEGVRCIIWQKERMRIISGVALERSALDSSAAGNREAYVYAETMPSVALRLTGETKALEQVCRTLTEPDSILMRLLEEDGQKLEEILSETRALAQEALTAHPDNELYTSLAQSLKTWCEMIGAMNEEGAKDVRSYAALTMSTICRELRIALMA